MVVLIDTVWHDVEPLAGLVDRRAVGQVTTGGQVETHIGIAWLQQRKEHGLVGLGARMRLDIDVLAVEQLLGALAGKFFGNVDMLTAAIVAPAGISFRVLVGHYRALSLHDRGRDDVLRRNQLDFMLLAAKFVGDGGSQRRVTIGQPAGKKVGKQSAQVACRLVIHVDHSSRSGERCRLPVWFPVISGVSLTTL